MNPLREYLEKVERNLIGMDDREKRRVLRDVEMQIIRISEDFGGGEEGIKKAIEEMGAAEELAKKYSDRYSLGFQDYAIISAISFFISLFTLPVIPFTTLQNIFSVAIIILLSLFIIFIGINWGMKAAIVPALVSAISRSSMFHITLWMYPLELSAEMKGIYIVHITSILIVLMVLAFPIPGKE